MEKSRGVHPVAGGFHAAKEIAGRTVTVFGQTEEQALAALQQACERAIELDRRVRRGDHLRGKG
jgi:hypothetical protein